MRLTIRSVSVGLVLGIGLLLALYLSFRTPAPQPDPETYALYRQGVQLLNDDRTDSAAAVLRRVVAADSTFTPAWTALAAVQQSRWRWDSAGEAYRRALAQQPGDPVLLHNYGAYLMMRGQFGPAIEELERAVTIDAGDPDLHALLGWAHLLARRYDDAEAPLRQALELDPDHEVALRALLQLYDAREEPGSIRALADRLEPLPQYRAWEAREDSAAAATLVAEYFRSDDVPRTHALEAAVLARQWEAFFAALDRWSREGTGSVLPVWLPRVDLQRFDPRFEAALERMGLAD